MSRPKKQRVIEIKPKSNLFLPQDIDLNQIEEITVELDELEALRLTNIELYSQQETASKMGISRQLVGLILNSGGKKITEALINGMAIKINT